MLEALGVWAALTVADAVCACLAGAVTLCIEKIRE
jgi:hypothetical protein